jgi:hypothetical protein
MVLRLELSISTILGEDNGTIRPNADDTAERHSILFASLRHHVFRTMVTEAGIIPAPVAIETHFPLSCSRETDFIIVQWPVCHIYHNNDIVPWPAVIPPMKCDNFLFIVHKTSP